jgi:membrane protein
MAVLLWVYYSAQIFLLGAEFTYVYAQKYGAGIKPLDRAHSWTVVRPLSG